MFFEEYEKLTQTEKENLKRMINFLLGKTFLVNKIYDTNTESFKYNTDYRFVESKFELLEIYFDIGGFKLIKDNNYEVIYLENIYEYNKKKLSKSSTLFLFALRLIYDQEREKVRLTQEVIIEVADIIKVLMDVGAITKKTTNAETKEALSELIRFNIIQKKDGNLENPNTKLIILPSILFALPNDKLNKLNNNINQIEEGESGLKDEEVNETIID